MKRLSCSCSMNAGCCIIHLLGQTSNTKRRTSNIKQLKSKDIQFQCVNKAQSFNLRMFWIWNSNANKSKCNKNSVLLVNIFGYETMHTVHNHTHAYLRRALNSDQKRKWEKTKKKLNLFIDVIGFLWCKYFYNATICDMYLDLEWENENKCRWEQCEWVNSSIRKQFIDQMSQSLDWPKRNRTEYLHNISKNSEPFKCICVWK